MTEPAANPKGAAKSTGAGKPEVARPNRSPLVNLRRAHDQSFVSRKERVTY